MKILVALDDSPFAEKVLETAITMATDKAAELHIISVAPTLEGIDDMPINMDDKLKSWAQAIVDKAVKKAADRGLAAKGHVGQDTFAAYSIAAQAKDIGASRVIVGHKGKSNLERLLVGSVAQAVVAQAPCSVFVVK